MKDRNQEYEMHAAALGGDIIRLRELLKAGGDPNELDGNGDSVLGILVSMNQDPIDGVRLLLEAGADPNCGRKEGQEGKTTALHAAILFSSEECLIALLNAGASLNQKSSGGNTPLEMARDKPKVLPIVIAEMERRELSVSCERGALTSRRKL